MRASLPGYGGGGGMGTAPMDGGGRWASVTGGGAGPGAGSARVSGGSSQCKRTQNARHGEWFLFSFEKERRVWLGESGRCMSEGVWMLTDEGS